MLTRSSVNYFVLQTILYFSALCLKGHDLGLFSRSFLYNHFHDNFSKTTIITIAVLLQNNNIIAGVSIQSH